MKKTRIAAVVGVGVTLLGAGILAAFAAAGPAGPTATTGTVTTVPSVPSGTTGTTAVTTATTAATTTTTALTTTAAPTLRFSAADRRFAARASGSDRFELATARIAMARAQSAQLRAFARRLVVAHTRSSARLRAIARPAALRLALSLSSAQQQQVARLLRTSDARLTQTFAQLQVRLHKQAIALYTREAAVGTNGQLSSFAISTLPMLRAHLRLARALAAGRR